MKKTGILMIIAFAIWTGLILIIDVQPVGVAGTEVGFANVNVWFHELTGVHMSIYTITDWLGLVPIFVCFMFGSIGCWQMIKRKSVLKVDLDIILLGAYYAIVILGYLLFEMFPINYRPILIEGRMEASYPSSTTLLVLSVMPTLCLQANHRLRNWQINKIISVLTIGFILFMVIGRLVSGVHWMTDIAGSVLLSSGLFYIYREIVLLYCWKEK